MIKTAALAATQGIVLWSLWVRRDTWRSPWDVSATLCLCFHAVALFLLSPWADFVDVGLHRLTGLWNVEDFIAHCFFIASAATLVHYALTRLARRRLLQLYCDRYVVYPYMLAVALMLACFRESNLSDQHDVEIMQVWPDWWGRAYWLVLSAVLAHLLWYAIRLMLRLRPDPRFRRQANFYILASLVGLLAMVARVVTALHPQFNPGGLVTWPCCDVGVAVFAIGFARVWRARERELRARRVVVRPLEGWGVGEYG